MFELHALHPLFGVELRGYALAATPDEAEFTELRRLLEQYSLLLLRDQDVGDAPLLAFARRFGRIDARGERPLAAWSNVGAHGELQAPTREALREAHAAELWRCGASGQERSARASVVAAREVPPAGGAAEFASTRAAWRDLSPATRERIDGLVALCDPERPRALVDPALATVSVPTPERRALVRTDPATGAKALCVDARVAALEGMAEEDAGPLLAALLLHATDPKFVYVHRWRARDVLVWDERFTLHRAQRFPPGARYRLVRAAVAAAPR